MIPLASPDIGAAERERVLDVLDSGQLADGEEVRAFEHEFARHCNTDHAVATTNGTTALHAAFEALEIGEGDAVATTPFSFIASANAIVHARAEPVLADVEPTTLTLHPDRVESVLEARGYVVPILPGHPFRTAA